MYFHIVSFAPPLITTCLSYVYFCDEVAFVRLDFAENFHSVSTTFDIFTLVSG